MKNSKQLLAILFLSVFCLTLLSSCARKRNCNGNWYNNRNVQQIDQPQDASSICFIEDSEAPQLD